MPITTARELRRVSEQEFHEVDYVVTGLAIQVHRDIGPWFIDESVYRDELVRMCQATGLTTHKELPVVTKYGTFSKSWFLDLVVNDSIPYELKAVEAIHPKHRSQTLNYLMLTGVAHAKILNMRCSSMQYEFVSTTITQADRYDFTIDLDAWQDLDADSQRLCETMCRLIQEWGVFLDLSVFYDAIEYFRGGASIVIQPIDIVRGPRIVGRQFAHLVNTHTAFKITAISKDLDEFEGRLRKFLAMTSLEAIQWINFNRRNVGFKTLVK